MNVSKVKYLFRRKMIKFLLISDTGGSEEKLRVLPTWVEPVASCNDERDSLGFWILRRRFRIPVTGFQVFVSGTRILGFKRSWNSGFQSPRFRILLAKVSRIRIPQETIFRIPESGLSYMGRNQCPFGNSPDTLPLSFSRRVETKQGACDPCLLIGSLGMVMLANRR